MSDDATQARILEALERLEGRLGALEAKMAPMDTFFQRAPILIDGGAQVVDQLMGQAAEQGIDVFERGERGAALLIKASSPATMDLADKVLDEEMLAGVGKLADKGAEVLKSDVLDTLLQSGLMDPERLGATIDALDRLAAVTATPEFQKLLDSGLLDGKTLDVAGSATTALVESRSGSVEPVGLFGTLGKLGDPDVKKAMGFMFAVLKQLGQKL